MENKRYKVVISNNATQMLLSHSRFLAQFNEGAAIKLVDIFNKKAKSLESMPKRNPFLEDSLLPIRKYRKLIFSNKYILIYQIKDDIVYVDYVLDCRQDYSWLL